MAQSCSLVSLSPSLPYKAVLRPSLQGDALRTAFTVLLYLALFYTLDGPSSDGTLYSSADPAVAD